MSDIWTDRLSDYLDNEMPASERVALETHLTECRECTDALAELRRVIARAAALQPRPPEQDLWPGVASRLDTPRAALSFLKGAQRRVSFTVPQLVAAGLALIVMSGGGVWVLNHGGRATTMPQVTAADPDAVPVALADPRYDEAVADLQQALQDGRGQLDAATIAILEANLAAIDKAIDESRRALVADPANLYLHNHLADARQRKLVLLRRAAALVNKG